MDLFSLIEGLRGEELCTRLLHYLIFNSPEIRNAFLEVLSNNSKTGKPIEYLSHFSCDTEVYTESENREYGRIDLTIELDDTIIGIENKFFSEFQENQPYKYFRTLKNIKDKLKEIRGKDIDLLFFILCPESRKEKIIENIIKNIKDENIQVSVVTWENILEKFEKIKNMVDEKNSVIFKEFVKYVNERIVFINNFEKKIIHYRKSFPPGGSVLQNEFVHKVWDAFPYSGSRISKGKNWIGYYFYDDKGGKFWDKGCKGWFGFVPKEEIKNIVGKDNNYILHEAEFIIFSTYKPKRLSDDFIEIELTNKYFIPGAENLAAWIVNFDKEWKNIPFWKEKLKPFFIEECKIK